MQGLTSHSPVPYFMYLTPRFLVCESKSQHDTSFILGGNWTNKLTTSELRQ